MEFPILNHMLQWRVYAIKFELRHEKPNVLHICENKDADQLRGNREADGRFCFPTSIVRFLYFSNPKFQASSHLL